MAGLEARRVDEHELGLVDGAHAGDAVARGLRLVGGDADLLADQRVQQRRLADVRPADDRHEPAPPCRLAGGAAWPIVRSH